MPVERLVQSLRSVSCCITSMAVLSEECSPEKGMSEFSMRRGTRPQTTKFLDHRTSGPIP